MSSRPLSACPYCGAANPGGATCPACGAPLGQVEFNLPLEFRGLKRPNPSGPVNPFGCVGIGFGLLWLAFSLFFVGFIVSTAYDEQQTYDLLRSEGQVVIGIITDLEIDDSGDSNDYIAYYRYPVVKNDRGTSLDDSQSIDEDLYDTLQVGQSVEVIYARSQPQVSQLKAAFGPPQPFLTLLMVLFSLSFVGAGIGFLVVAIRGLRRYLRLRREGQETWATVFDRWQDSDSDGDPTYAVAYVFQAQMPDGTLRRVTRAELNKAVYDRVQIGSRIPIRYVPADPEITSLQ